MANNSEYDLVLPGTGGRYLIAMAAARKFVKKASEQGLSLRNIYAASGGVFAAVHVSADYEDPRDWVVSHWKKTKKFKLGGWRIFKQVYNLLTKRGFFKWEDVRDVFRETHPHKELRKPIWIVVWDLSRNAELLLPLHEWKDKDIGEGMTVSCSLPVIITPPQLRVKDFPKSVHAEMLEDCGPTDLITVMDGCLSSDTPADVAAQLGFETIPVVVISLDNFGGYNRDVEKANLLDHLTSMITATMEANRVEDTEPMPGHNIHTLFIDTHGFEGSNFRFNLTKEKGLRMVDRGVSEMNRRLRENPCLFDAIKGKHH